MISGGIAAGPPGILAGRRVRRRRIPRISSTIQSMNACGNAPRSTCASAIEAGASTIPTPGSRRSGHRYLSPGARRRLPPCPPSA
ncbi:hypothetical protein L494_0463 [Bordetella bronchiseptica CA90 BB1334]|nr:hypothetical protein L494_0463 [Bordetella bronchiseptica CA90 BB1334]